MDAQARFRTQLVGALPAVVHYFGELDLAATIDELVPWEGDIPLGTLVEVLVAVGQLSMNVTGMCFAWRTPANS